MSAITNALQNALQNEPSNWEARLGLMEALIAEGQSTEAFELLRTPPAMPETVGGLQAAVRCYELANLADARQVLTAALSQHPGNPAATQLLAQLPAVVAAEEPEPEYIEPLPDVVPMLTSRVPLTSGLNRPLTTAQVPVLSHETSSVDLLQSEELMIDPTKPTAVMTEDGTVKMIAAKADVVDELAAEVREQEKAAEKNLQKARARDTMNALVLTVLAHVGLVVALSAIVLTVPMVSPPEIIGHAAASNPNSSLEPTKIVKTTTSQPTQTQQSTAASQVITAKGSSGISMASSDVGIGAPTAMLGIGDAFAPSMSFDQGGEAGAMLFGTKVEGKVLGVIADVSGSMAEYLHKVVREVDKNYPKSPIVFVNDTVLRAPTGDGTDMWPVVAEDVVPSRDGRQTPYWFLWGDLPRKAEQASVDRLIEIFKSRQNCFLAVGGGNRIAAAMDFLTDQKCDSIYIISDFEDFTDEKAAEEYAKKLTRAKIKVYTQPSEDRSEFLQMYATNVVNRTSGRELPPLIDVASKSEADMVKAEMAKSIDMNEMVHYATPRKERDTKEFFGREWASDKIKILGTYEHKNFDAVFYGPEARVHIYLKSPEGYIQRPMIFHYWSGKWEEDPRYGRRHTRRPFVKAREEPTWDNKTCTWLMEMEGGYKFDIELRVDNNELIATYAADLPAEGADDIHPANLYFIFPKLGHESKDLYYNYDFEKGLTLDQVRVATKANKCIFHLPGQFEDQYGTHWNQIGFKGGYNERTFDVLVRVPPNGVRDMQVSGKSFGPRDIKIATTSNRLLMNTHFGRSDLELWEGFGASLTRPNENRHRWTKTEAFKLTVD